MCILRLGGDWRGFRLECKKYLSAQLLCSWFFSRIWFRGWLAVFFFTFSGWVLLPSWVFKIYVPVLLFYSRLYNHGPVLLPSFTKLTPQLLNLSLQYYPTEYWHYFHFLRECLNQIPHQKFSFAKIWLLAAQFEIRQLNLTGARQMLGNAIGNAPTDKVTY